jgi:hypothetical protein
MRGKRSEDHLAPSEVASYMSSLPLQVQPSVLKSSEQVYQCYILKSKFAWSYPNQMLKHEYTSESYSVTNTKILRKAQQTWKLMLLPPPSGIVDINKNTTSTNAFRTKDISATIVQTSSANSIAIQEDKDLRNNTLTSTKI